MSATESLIEWYFKILVRYRGFMKSIPMITMKYHHEISEIMRLDTDYSQSSESWTLGLRTLRSVQSLPTKSLGLAGPISEHFQLYNSDQDIFFHKTFKNYEVLFFTYGETNAEHGYTALCPETPLEGSGNRWWLPQLFVQKRILKVYLFFIVGRYIIAHPSIPIRVHGLGLLFPWNWLIGTPKSSTTAVSEPCIHL